MNLARPNAYCGKTAGCAWPVDQHRRFNLPFTCGLVYGIYKLKKKSITKRYGNREKLPSLWHQEQLSDGTNLSTETMLRIWTEYRNLPYSDNGDPRIGAFTLLTTWWLDAGELILYPPSRYAIEAHIGEDMQAENFSGILLYT
jgi:hypothetical protein